MCTFSVTLRLGDDKNTENLHFSSVLYKLLGQCQESNSYSLPGAAPAKNIEFFNINFAIFELLDPENSYKLVALSYFVT